jgi:hypothetical protein
LSEADFLNAIRTVKRPHESEIDPVMPRAFGQTNDAGLTAVWAFLRTVPAAATGER